MFSFLSLNVSDTLCSCRINVNRLRHRAVKRKCVACQFPFISAVPTLLAGMMGVSHLQNMHKHICSDKPLFGHFGLTG